MHEDQERAFVGSELIFEPRLPGAAVVTGVCLRSPCVEKQAAGVAGIDKSLRKTASVAAFREYLEKCRAVVVIADAELRRHWQLREPLFQSDVVATVAPVGEISGDDQQLRIPVIAQDMRERALEIGVRIAPDDHKSQLGSMATGVALVQRNAEGIGSGSLGSSVAAMLARIGIGRLLPIDARGLEAQRQYKAFAG